LKQHIKKNWFIYLVGLSVLVFSILFPDFYIEVRGGFAWLSFIISVAIGSALIVTSIFGGEFKIESEGLIPTIKRWVKRK
jgi:uncharacterized membrane protein YwaF